MFGNIWKKLWTEARDFPALRSYDKYAAVEGHVPSSSSFFLLVLPLFSNCMSQKKCLFTYLHQPSSISSTSILSNVWLDHYYYYFKILTHSSEGEILWLIWFCNNDNTKELSHNLLYRKRVLFFRKKKVIQKKSSSQASKTKKQPLLEASEPFF